MAYARHLRLMIENQPALFIRVAVIRRLKKTAKKTNPQKEKKDIAIRMRWES